MMLTEASVWGPVQREMAGVLAGHPGDVPGVVDQLTRLQEVVGQVPNPLADFNRLYLAISENVLERLFAGSFADPGFVARLDVEFAGRYFDALRQWSDAGTGCPRSWTLLLSRIPCPETGATASAAAGLNAHLHYDLPFALVTTLDFEGCEPVDGSDQHRDYLQINEIFAERIPGLRRGYLDRWQLLIDMMNGDLDDWWQGTAVEWTRNVAWRNTQKLWSIRHDLRAVAAEQARLDRTAESLGKLLLSPMGSLLQ
ncbi:DUF5995 family protein [Actinoplanes sp. RD1]|uniref:DUF5995 family protein n=1 Tax=Actinoplanes sp. RD1 TaxID=3064538 RepID=UPI002741DE3A|nr:DUF5995 family protein [Actinoplanes sp. RD1]